MISTGLRIYNASGTLVLDSTRRTPLYLGDTPPSTITGGEMRVALPAFTEGDSNNLMVILRVTGSNSDTQGSITSITNTTMVLTFKGTKYSVDGYYDRTPMPPHGSYTLTVYRW